MTILIINGVFFKLIVYY